MDFSEWKFFFDYSAFISKRAQFNNPPFAFTDHDRNTTIIIYFANAGTIIKKVAFHIGMQAGNAAKLVNFFNFHDLNRLLILNGKVNNNIWIFFGEKIKGEN